MFRAMAVGDTVTPHYTTALEVAPLIEARVFSLRSAAAADAYSEELARVVSRVPLSQSPVLCADHRPVAIYPEPVADRLVELFRSMNPRISRIAILVAPSNATLVLQLERLVREAHNEHRKVCHDPQTALAHLRSALQPTALTRAHAFLSEYRALA